MYEPNLDPRLRPHPRLVRIRDQGSNSSAIGTLVDRTTRYVKLVHLPEGRSADTSETPSSRPLPAFPQLSPVGSHGTRAARWAATTSSPSPRASGGLFCEPGSPWHRPTNENSNGLLRQYFPKGTDLSLHSVTDLAVVAAELNDRPRKALGWQTPAHHFSRLIATVG
ncbi:IS30 family transposase [Streptomyces globisporus]|uniref:IS30 family transposase n=1 Tax=Streptomyces globisporus TaxID=1908 RepID=UPI00386FA56D